MQRVENAGLVKNLFDKFDHILFRVVIFLPSKDKSNLHLAKFWLKPFINNNLQGTYLVFK